MAFPSILLEKQKALGLDAIDMNIIMHLASYWWTAENKPHPKKSTIAEAIGVTPRTVQRRIAALEKAGLIRREERRVTKEGSLPNLYHFDGLIKEATPFAMEKIEIRQQRKEEDERRIKRKGRPELKLVKTSTPDELE
ncbi:Helix-turn-helix domain-containing protein (plasmid) [Methylocaldum szegediense]|uniref:Helix-turn-helix domain-containing protein n=1 Tax=Methylocaldum szegediense TaxID=73780 RepID=A0ABN8XB20_9GAMM|nr:Helix-turn-helix domain-containing protein [Methylocaldum szegediense]